MPIYHQLGRIPPKRHTIFRQPDGTLYHEQLFGTIGFDGMSSLLYHVHPPTMIREVGSSIDVRPDTIADERLQPRLLRGFEIEAKPDFLASRIPVLVNQDIQIQLAAPSHSVQDYFYKNADADEMIFVHKGTGQLHTMMGVLQFEPGDYIIIPRGMIYQIVFDQTDNRLLIAESYHPIYTPKRYRNWFGQLSEHAPFCERDYKLPALLETHHETGEFLIKVKKQGHLHQLVYASHPFDVVGWDGYNYAYAFSIHNFEPITGRVHQPPPVHQTFETSAFVICSFCPRLYDYHPEAIPAPYNHSNIDSDEVLYYVDGDFMSRNHIDQGYLTIHPGGIPHGPHPGAYERSIGKERTDELAVMIDTFRPLKLTRQALGIEDPSYHLSWLPEEMRRERV